MQVRFKTGNFVVKINLHNYKENYQRSDKMCD